MSWAIPLKGRDSIYEAGVMQYEDGVMSLYQTVSKTLNGLRPMEGNMKEIVVNMSGFDEKYDNGKKG